MSFPTGTFASRRELFTQLNGYDPIDDNSARSVVAGRKKFSHNTSEDSNPNAPLHRRNHGGAERSRKGRRPIAMDDAKEVAVLLNATTLQITEGGGAGRYTVSLSARPLHLVTVECVLVSFLHEVMITPNELQFTPQDWRATRKVKVHAIDDGCHQSDELLLIQHRLHSADPRYGRLNILPSITLHVIEVRAA